MITNSNAQNPIQSQSRGQIKVTKKKKTISVFELCRMETPYYRSRRKKNLFRVKPETDECGREEECGIRGGGCCG